MTQHYFAYLAEIKRTFAELKLGFGAGATHWNVWLARPYSSQTFDMVEKFGRPPDIKHKQAIKAFQLYQDVTDKLRHIAAGRGWVYGIEYDESEAVEKAFKQASKLCQCASTTLLTKGSSEEVKKLVQAYFSDERFDPESQFADLAGQYTSVMHALMSHRVIFTPGDVARSGRHAIAYVDGQQDNLALDQSGLNHVFNGNFGVVRINPGFYSSGSGTPKVDAAFKGGVTVLHELTHLFSKIRAQDYEIGMINSEVAKKYKVKTNLLHECYGRAACKALGVTRYLTNMSNADTLALLAIDLYLLQVKGESLDVLLELT